MPDPVEAELMAGVPPDLRDRVMALRPTLLVNGVVQHHRKVWRLRYRDDDETGERRHLSLRLGPDEGLAHRVRNLITHWRECATEQRRLEAEQVKLRRIEIQALRTAAMLSTKGGRDRRWAAARAAEDAYNGTVKDLLRYMFAPRSMPFGRPGRPRKFQLW